MDDDPSHNRHDNERDHGQLQIDIGHQDKGSDQRHHGNEYILRTVMGHLADIVQIIGNPTEQMTGFIVIEEAEGELLDMIEHFLRISVSIFIPSMCPQ